MTFKEKYGDKSSEICKGNLDVSSQKLTSLEGCYKEIKGNFNCSYNKLTSLKYGPKVVNGNFLCYNNKLTSLKYGPKIVNVIFDCSKNKLTSLEGGPKIVQGTFNGSDNELTSLEGAPKIIDGSFWCTANFNLKSLDELLGTEIKRDVVSNIMTSKEFKADQKLFNKVQKNLSKYKKLKKLLKATS